LRQPVPYGMEGDIGMRIKPRHSDAF